MGVGKTTLGLRLAEKLGLAFYDLDAQIERDTSTSIREIFETQGENVFRAHETRVLRRLIEAQSNGVLATGGGAFTIEENRGIMETAGVSVWLDAPIEVIVERASSGERPLWQNDAQVRALAERRKKDYRLANHHLDLGTDSTLDGAARLYELLAAHSDD